jgi:chromosomal replication initiation ATPase DnaA
MAVPTRFMRDWVQSNYADRIRLLWVEEDEKVNRVDIVVQVANRPTAQRPGQDGAARLGNGAASAAAPSQFGNRARNGRDDGDRAAAVVCDISAPLDPRFTFENFIVGKPNELAYAVQSALPLWRRRPRQDSFDARDRLADPQARAQPKGRLSLGRKVHVPVRAGA